MTSSLGINPNRSEAFEANYVNIPQMITSKQKWILTLSSMASPSTFVKAMILSIISSETKTRGSMINNARSYHEKWLIHNFPCSWRDTPQSSEKCWREVNRLALIHHKSYGQIKNECILTRRRWCTRNWKGKETGSHHQRDVQLPHLFGPRGQFSPVPPSRSRSKCMWAPRWRLQRKKSVQRRRYDYFWSNVIIFVISIHANKALSCRHRH